MLIMPDERLAHYLNIQKYVSDMQRFISGRRLKKILLPAAVCGVLMCVTLSLVAADDAENPILDFYVQRAEHAFTSRNPAETGVSYSFQAKFYRKVIEKGGVTGSVDSAVIDYFYSWGKLDSLRPVSGDFERFKDTDLDYPDVFKMDYIYNLYPNDTGGQELAIGFDTRTAEDTLPTGLVIIDRELYYPMWLYLSYPNKVGYKRFTRSFRFTEVEGMTFADSVWEVGAKAGVFFSEYYRIETGITDITVSR